TKEKREWAAVCTYSTGKIDARAAKHDTFMMMETVHVQGPARRSSYEIKIGNSLLGQVGNEARAALGGKPRRVALVSNHEVFALFGAVVARSLRTSGFEVAKWLMKDGERHKNLRSLEQALNFFNEAGLERNDAVVALGGG